MKIETDRKLETNIASAVQFKISENASKLFAMLGSYLYSKKEECVLHELSANAIDAHKMVEHEPIHVILPTRLDSQLRIRDFGPGLSEEHVYRFLTTYGESNKQGSNDFIGGWGIGSKSPASVSDTWKILSHHEGTLTEYLVFINGDGIPSLTKIRSVPTEETGLEVAIPIPDSRISSWQQVIPSVYAFYPVTPKVTNTGYYGGVKKRVPDTKCGANWWYSAGDTGIVNVIASNRCYPCDTAKLTAEMKDARAKSLLGMPLFLEMSVGQVDLSISREQMQFTRKTIEQIEARLIEIFDSFKVKFDAAVTGYTDELDYRVRVMKYMKDNFNQSHHGMQSLPFMVQFVAGKFGIRNTNDLVKYRFGIADMLESDLIALDIRVYNGKALKALNASFNCWRDYAITADNEYINGKRLYDIRVQIDKLPRIKFYLADTKDAYARVKNEFDLKTTGFAVVFKTLDKVPALIASRVVKTSTLAVVPRAARGTGVAARAKLATDIYVMDGGRFVRKDGKEFYEQDVNGNLVPVKNLAYVVTDTFASTGTLAYDKIVAVLRENYHVVIGVKDVTDVPVGVPSHIDAFETYVKKVMGEQKLKEEIERMMVNAIWGGDFTNLQTRAAVRTTKTDSIWNTFVDKHAARIKAAGNPHRDRSTYYPMVERVGHLSTMLAAAAPTKPKLALDMSELDSIKKDLTEMKETYKMLHYLRTDVAMDHDFRQVVTQFLDLTGV
jgi:hypothetical protein